MEQQDKRASHIRLTDFRSRPMRAFHMAWLALFLCFFSWFGTAPLLSIIRRELALSEAQIGWTLIASVAGTIAARLAAGWLCDRIGPRLAYTWLLLLGALPVMAITLADTFAAFLLFRFLVGAIGAGFVITQVHTSVMFAPRCVGTATATTAGWGNLGGGVTQMVMPLLFALFTGLFGMSDYWGWRLCMLLAGLLTAAAGIAYYFLTDDSPDGSTRPANRIRHSASSSAPSLWGDGRVWSLFLIYGACFGVELTIKNIAALYFTDYFGLGLKAAGIAAAAYGGMNLFARTLGGYLSDRLAARWGADARPRLLFLALLAEASALAIFASMQTVGPAIAALALVGLFVQMSSGATYAVVPFINPRRLGAVAGIVGAGGNAGAVAAGFLFQGAISWPSAILILGLVAAAIAPLALCLRLEPAEAVAPTSPAPALLVADGSR